jgi:hypothetical protein
LQELKDVHPAPLRRGVLFGAPDNDLMAQTRAAMDGINQTLDAAGASFKDVVRYFVFRARPRMGDIGKSSAVINSYFAPWWPTPVECTPWGGQMGKVRIG